MLTVLSSEIRFFAKPQTVGRNKRKHYQAMSALKQVGEYKTEFFQRRKQQYNFVVYSTTPNLMD